MKASSGPLPAFEGGCTCWESIKARQGCTCGWGAFVERLLDLADQTDPVLFIRETGKLGEDLDRLLATRRPAAVRKAIEVFDGDVPTLAERLKLSRQRIYKLAEGTGSNRTRLA